jgi:uncharacterized membrane protein
VSSRKSVLAPRQRWLLFGVLAGSSLGIAMALLAFGAWPVLPWSCLEVAALALAFWHVERRARDWERLVVAGDRVIVERESRGRCERCEWNRCWVQVEIEGAADAGASLCREPRLSLRFAGQTVEFGGDLPPSERARVARELKRLLAAR